MIPPGFALATAGTIWRKMAAFLRTRSRRVSPGFWAAPAAMTVIAAPRHSSIGPDQTRAVFANGTAWRRSMASPSARRTFASTSRISAASPDRRRPNAKVDPTAPAPTIATRVGWASGDSVARPPVGAGAVPDTGWAGMGAMWDMAPFCPGSPGRVGVARDQRLDVLPPGARSRPSCIRRGPRQMRPRRNPSAPPRHGRRDGPAAALPPPSRHAVVHGKAPGWQTRWMKETRWRALQPRR